MYLITSTKQDTYVIQVNGGLDSESALLLDEAIGEAVPGTRRLLIDCAALTSISAAGLGVLLTNLKPLRDKNIELMLLDVTPWARDVFRVMGMDTLIRSTTSKPDARA